MSFEQLIELLNTVSALPVAPATAGIQAQLESAWRSNRIKALSDLMDAHGEVTPAALINFLDDSWSITRGTSLTYTAQPNTALTQLMLTIAWYVAEQAPDRSPLDYLMPGVRFESCKTNYPDLTPHSITELTHLIKTHVLTHDGLYLLPVQLLTELELPPATTQLPNPYYDFQQADSSDGWVSPQALQQLETHSEWTEALFNAKRYVETLSQDNSHLLGQLNQLCHLLSINAAHGGRGQQENAAEGAFPAIIAFNKFYTRLTDEQKTHIPSPLAAEIDLLLKVSNDSTFNQNATNNMETCIGTRRERLVKTMHGHEALLSEISMTPDHKAQLIEQSRLAFTQAKQALQMVINQSAYSGCDKQPITLAIMQYLGLQWIMTSPSDLHLLRQLNNEEISALLQEPNLLASLKRQLPHLSALVMFILDTRIDKLPALLLPLQPHINQLVTNSQALAALLSILPIDKYTSVLQLFVTQLTSPSPLLRENRRGLFDFVVLLKELSPEQCALLLKMLHDRLPTLVKPDIAAILNNIDGKKSILFYGAMRPYFPELMRDANTALKIINNIDTRKQHLCLRVIEKLLPQLYTHFAHLENIIQDIIQTNFNSTLINAITTLDEVIFILNGMDNTECALFIENMAAQLPGLITSPTELVCFIQQTQPSIGPMLLQIINDLPAWLKDHPDATFTLLKSLHHTRYAMFFQWVQRHSPDCLGICANLSNLMLICDKLYTPQRQALFECIQTRLPGLIQNRKDILLLSYHLTKHQFTQLLESIREYLGALTQPDLVWLLRSISSDKMPLLVHAILLYTSHLVCNSTDVINLCHHLITNQDTAEFLDYVSKHPYAADWVNKPQMIINLASQIRQENTSLENVISIFCDVITTKEECLLLIRFLQPAAISEALTQHIQVSLPTFIDWSAELSQKLNSIEPSNFQMALQILHNYPPYIHHAESAAAVLQSLSPDRYPVFFAVIEQYAPDWLHDFNCLKKLLNKNKLSEPQQLQVIRIMQPHWIHLIRTCHDIINALFDDSLYPAGHALFTQQLEQMLNENQLTDLITNYGDLAPILNRISPSTQASLLQHLRPRLPNLIKSATNLKNICDDLEHLNNAQIQPLLEKMESHLPNLIANTSDLICILQLTRPIKSIHQSLFKQIQSRLPNLIKSAYDLSHVCQYLNDAQRSQLLEDMEANLPNMMIHWDDVEKTLKLLTKTKQKTFLTSIQDRLLNLLPNNPSDIAKIVKYITDPQQQTMFLQGNRPYSAIKSAKSIAIIIKHISEQHWMAFFQGLQNYFLTENPFTGTRPFLINIQEILAVLTVEQCSVFLTVIQPHLAYWIGIGEAHQHLTPLSTKLDADKHQLLLNTIHATPHVDTNPHASSITPSHHNRFFPIPNQPAENEDSSRVNKKQRTI